MIVRLFKTNQIYIYAFIPIVLLFLRWPVLMTDPPFTPSGQLPVFSDFFAWLSDYHIISLLLGVIAITYQAYELSEVCNEHRLVQYSSNLIAFVLAISYAVFIPHLWFSPVILANVFVVLALKRILHIFHQGGIYGDLFRIGIYIGLASLFYLPSILMLLILFYDLAIIRSFKWREYLIPVTGLITPYVYVLAYYYVKDQSEILFNYFIEPKTFLSFLELKPVNWIPALILTLVLIASGAFMLSTVNKRTVRENNLFKVISATMVLAILLALIFRKDFMSATVLLWPSVSIILTYFLLGIERNWIREGIVYLLLLSIIGRDIMAVLN